MDPTEALAALDAKRSAERELATVADCPPWRHAVFAAMMAALVATPAVPLALRFVTIALVMVAVALVVQSDRKRLGVFINGYRRGKTRLVTFAMLAAVLPLYALSTYLSLRYGDHRTPLLLAAVAFVISYFGSVVWQRVFRREMGL
jgi:hypothetical protein